MLRPVLYILICFSFVLTKSTLAQCPTKISSFPYNEGFETDNGNWTTGGANSDWAWGTPAKSVISSAGSGTKCWIVGGLSGNAYANGEASWIQSPCFDFTSLKYPYIFFKVFWDTEKNYDGAGMQYSVDEGTTWKDIGSVSSADNCLNNNWYNTGSVRYLSGLANSQNGWSGSGQSGSGGWVTANHVINELEGKPSVIFRFLFGAGTTNNNYNGFAIDDVYITEAPSNRAGFDFACAGNSTVKFTNTSDFCPSYEWDFDDPLSGATNTSQDKDPTHKFIGSGKHSVSLIVSSIYNKPDTFTSVVTTMNISTSITTQIKCFDDANGQVMANAVGTAETINYKWNTQPEQTGTLLSNISAGNYTVTASANNTCDASETIVLSGPEKLVNSVLINQPGCLYQKGEATVIESGGTPPYNYLWTSGGGTNATATGLNTGNYSVKITDQNLCTDFANIDIIKIFPPVVNLDTIINVACNGGNNGSAVISISGGSFPFTVQWNSQPVQTGDTLFNVKAGNYTVKIGDSNGCIVIKSAVVTEPPVVNKNVIIDNATCGYKNGKITLLASGNFQYSWAPSVSSGPVADNISPGIYSVQLKNSGGCLTEISDIEIKNIGKPARPNLGKDTSFCSGEKIIVSPGIFTKYIWQNNTTDNVYTINETGKYWVTVTNNENCSATDSINVVILEHCIDLYFPDIFSPNNDGLNDGYGPVGNFNAVSNYELVIFNRLGEKVFKTNNPREKWNGEYKGKISPNSAYVWRATYIFNGQGKKIKQGSLIIIK